jgi:hypothetical protein
MPFLPAGVGASIAGGVAAAGAGALINGVMSPGTSGASNGSSLYIPTGLGYEDQNIQNLTGNELTQYQQSTGLGQNYALQSLFGGQAANSQYGAPYQQMANAAASQYNGNANLQQQYAGTLNGQASQAYGTANSLLNAGQQVYNMGLDPNQAEYNQGLNNLTQQTGATNSMYGLGSSGVGAGVQNQALGNYNIGWNAQQLQNAATGLSAYDSAASQAGNYNSLGNADLNGAVSMNNGAAQSMLQAGQTPYSTAQSIQATPGTLANTYGSYLNANAYGPAEAIQGGAQNYLNAGEGVNATAFNAGSQNAQNLGSSVASGLGGLGNAVQNAGGFANLFGGTTGSFGGGNFSGAFNSSPYYSGGGNSYGFTS